VDAFCDDSGGRFVLDPEKNMSLKGLDVTSFFKDPRVQKVFLEDVRSLDNAEACLLILPSGRSAHLEAGYVKGQGKWLVIWTAEHFCEDFDVMHCFADLITSEIECAIEFFNHYSR